MSEWRTLPLEDALDRLIDYRGKSPPKSLSGIPVISAKVVKAGRITAPIEQKIATSFYPQWMTRGLPNAGDVVLTTEGPLGEVAQLDDQTARYALGQRVVCLQPKHGVLDGTFLKFLLMSPVQQSRLSGFATGTTVAGISQKALRSVPITIPPFADQVMIGKVAGALDDKIELNRRMNETLEAMARAIFQDWFVAFGPTRAKMEGRAPYLAPDLWALFPEGLDGEGKPEGWQAGPISSFASLGRESVSPMSSPDELFDHYSLPAFDAGQVAVRELGAGILSNKTLVSRHAILLSKLNPEIPRVWLVDADAAIRSICSTEFLVLMPNIEADRAFLYCALTDPGFKQRLEAQVTGTSKSHQRVNARSVLEAAVVTAPPVVMSAFHHQATPLLERILANRRESRTLAATRDLLLPRLMSGELRVKDAERAVEEAA